MVSNDSAGGVNRAPQQRAPWCDGAGSSRLSLHKLLNINNLSTSPSVGTRADCRQSSLRESITVTPLPVSEPTALTADFPLPHPSPTAIYKDLDEGGVLLSTSDEVYFGVNPVGAKIWSLLPPASRTFGELCAVLEREYPDAGSDRIRADVQEFIEALTASGLVVPSAT